jgi:hypothetical protein
MNETASNPLVFAAKMGPLSSTVMCQILLAFFNIIAHKDENDGY